MRRRSRSSVRSAASTISWKRRCARRSRSTIRATRSCSARRQCAIRSSVWCSSLIAEHPQVPAKLLVGDERISANPKLNNVLKGWRAAANDRIVMADSNVLMPRDYLQRLLATLGTDTGMVSAPPVGSHPLGFWAQMECVFLNTYQARWQYTADTIGLGFAQGKTLFYRRSDIEAAGGLRALAAEAAEDAASTKIMRASGTPRAAGRCAVPATARRAPARRRLGPAGALGAAAARQLPRVLLSRSRLRRRAAAASRSSSSPPPPAIRSSPRLRAPARVWYGAEMLLAAAAGWHLPLLYPAARDAARPAVAGAVVRRLARGRFRLARQRHERRRK